MVEKISTQNERYELRMSWPNNGNKLVLNKRNVFDWRKKKPKTKWAEQAHTRPVQLKFFHEFKNHSKTTRFVFDTIIKKISFESKAKSNRVDGGEQGIRKFRCLHCAHTHYSYIHNSLPSVWIFHSMHPLSLFHAIYYNALNVRTQQNREKEPAGEGAKKKTQPENTLIENPMNSNRSITWMVAVGGWRRYDYAVNIFGSVREIVPPKMLFWENRWADICVIWVCIRFRSHIMWA